MKLQNMQHMNEAIFILRHFIDLSAKLLPILYQLDKKTNPSKEERIDREKIIQVFNTYNFNTNASRYLLESDILEFINQCFESTAKNHIIEEKEYRLSKFLNEYERLKKEWKHIELN